jgi:hypothetical protein
VDEFNVQAVLFEDSEITRHPEMKPRRGHRRKRDINRLKLFVLSADSAIQDRDGNAKLGNEFG